MSRPALVGCAAPARESGLLLRRLVDARPSWIGQRKLLDRAKVPDHVRSLSVEMSSHFSGARCRIERRPQKLVWLNAGAKNSICFSAVPVQRPTVERAIRRECPSLRKFRGKQAIDDGAMQVSLTVI